MLCPAEELEAQQRHGRTKRTRIGPMWRYVCEDLDAGSRMAHRSKNANLCLVEFSGCWIVRMFNVHWKVNKVSRQLTMLTWLSHFMVHLSFACFAPELIVTDTHTLGSFCGYVVASVCFCLRHRMLWWRERPRFGLSYGIEYDVAQTSSSCVEWWSRRCNPGSRFFFFFKEVLVRWQSKWKMVDTALQIETALPQSHGGKQRNPGRRSMEELARGHTWCSRWHTLEDVTHALEQPSLQRWREHWNFPYGAMIGIPRERLGRRGSDDFGHAGNSWAWWSAAWATFPFLIPDHTVPPLAAADVPSLVLSAPRKTSW